jgi:hypothetical protein
MPCRLRLLQRRATDSDRTHGRWARSVHHTRWSPQPRARRRGARLESWDWGVSKLGHTRPGGWQPCAGRGAGKGQPKGMSRHVTGWGLRDVIGRRPPRWLRAEASSLSSTRTFRRPWPARRRVLACMPWPCHYWQPRARTVPSVFVLYARVQFVRFVRKIAGRGGKQVCGTE